MSQDWAPWISGGFTVVAVGLTVFLTHLFQQQREDRLSHRSVTARHYEHQRSYVIEAVKAAAVVRRNLARLVTEPPKKGDRTEQTEVSKSTRSTEEVGAVVDLEAAVSVVEDDEFRRRGEEMCGLAIRILDLSDSDSRSQTLQLPIQQYTQLMNGLTQRSRELLGRTSC